MRLFIAIRFSEEIQRTLREATDELRAQSVSGNYTRPENLHLTLAFIGESNETGKLRRVLDGLDAAPFSFSVSGAGRFGDTWWVGVERAPALIKLADELRQKLLAAGFELDTKPFKPHITIARQVAAEGAVSLNVPQTSMTVSRISLMKSERLNGRLTYTEVYGRAL